MKPGGELAIGLASFAGFQVLAAYQNSAPSLPKIREAGAGDWAVRTQLQDADILIGGLALIVGVTASRLMNNWTPLLLMAAVFGFVSLWHHMVANGSSPIGED